MWGTSDICRMSRRRSSDGLLLLQVFDSSHCPIFRHFKFNLPAYCYRLPVLQATTTCCCGSFAASLLHARQSSHRRWQESGVTVPVFHSLCLAILSIAFHPKILGCHKSACLELAALHCSRLVYLVVGPCWSYLVADWGFTGWGDSSIV